MIGSSMESVPRIPLTMTPRNRYLVGTAALAILVLLNCSTPLTPLRQEYRQMQASPRTSSLQPLTVVRQQTRKYITIMRGSHARTQCCVLPAAGLGGIAGVGAGGVLGSTLFRSSHDFPNSGAIGGVIGAVSGMLIGGLGTYALVQHSERISWDSAGLPDIGELVMDKFAERVRGEVPGWPAMSVESMPVGESYSRRPGYTLELWVGQTGAQGYTDRYSRYSTSAYATLYYASGDTIWDIIWERVLSWQARQGTFHASRLGATDKYAWLREDMEDAADATVSDLIAHLKE